MQDIVDRLSTDLSAKYVQYLETLLVDLWSENGFIEFRAGFSLRSDHVLRSFTVKVEATAGRTDIEREVLIKVVFEEIEQQIDLAIADVDVQLN